MKPKISIIGAGNVGREVASWCAVKELGDIVLWNRSVARAKGNALDLSESAPLAGFNVNILGTNKISDTKNSSVIVFTAGAPRKPGMKREELAQGNADVVRPLIKKLAKASPQAVLIMVTNPLDVMTSVAYKASGFPKKRVIGMAGILDTSRFESFIAKAAKAPIEDVRAVVIGSHGENMVSLPRLSRVGGKPLTEVLSKKKIAQLVKHTKEAGAEIVKLLKANASFSVGAAATKLVQSVVKNKRQRLPCSVLLKGEYGLHNVFIGVPCIIGSKGLEKVVELKLNADERKQLHAAAKRIKTLTDSVR